MRTNLPFVATLGVCAVLASGTALAQLPEEIACTKTRAEVKSDCIQFMKTHRWDEGASNWVLKTGVRPPEGVKSREEVKAERDKFLAANRWNDGKTAWEAIPGKPRDMSQEPLGCEMTRAEVKKDCVQFLKTHRFDEGMGAYVKK